VATKTEELATSLQLEVARAVAQLEGLKDEVRKADLVEIRDTLMKVHTHITVVDVPKLIAQFATLQEQVAELKKWRDERDRRSWQFWLGVGMCVLTLFVNLFVIPRKSP
jgi:hypothetical protein